MMENANPNIARVQHVAKSSSDQLLRKFAEVGSDSEHKSSSKDLTLAKRVRRSKAKKDCGGCSSKSSGNGNGRTGLAERKSLLPSAAPHKPPMALVRRLIRARELKNRSVVAVIEKTWRRTVEGASRVLMEKHYNRHKRLINDSY